eukprot:gene27357-4658_t
MSRALFSAALQQTRGEQTMAMSTIASFMSKVPNAPKDPILGITENFLKDPSPQKMNLGVGAYRDDDGKPVVLPSVREAEKRVSGTHFMEYLPIQGLKEFNSESIKLAYGENADVIKNKQVAVVQSLSGTGSCRLMAEFQRRWMPGSKVYIPQPTWSNHHNIWHDAGVEEVIYREMKIIRTSNKKA